MNRAILAAPFAAMLALTGCNGTIIPPVVIPNVITEPAQVQAACTLVSLAVPVAELFRDRLTVAEQGILTSAEAALKACSDGNATAAIIEVATAIENLLANRGTTRAMLMRRAGAR